MKTKYFKLTTKPQWKMTESIIAFSKADLVDGDEANHNTEVIEQAISQNKLAVDDYGEWKIGNITLEEITLDQYVEGLKQQELER